MDTREKPLHKPVTYWIGEGAGWLLTTRRKRPGGHRHDAEHVYVSRACREFVGGGAFRLSGDSAQAAAVLFLAAFLDMADGQVARRVGRVTAFGAFLDSTLDRYSDLALYMGLVVYYTLIGRPFYMTLAAVAMASSFMVSYSRARAESLIPPAKWDLWNGPRGSCC